MPNPDTDTDTDTTSSAETTSPADDPTVAVWFDPGAIREHFAETAHEARSLAYSDSDSALAAAARRVVVDSDRLWALFDELCLDVLDLAHELHASGA